MTLELTDNQVDLLRTLTYPYCVETDVESALSRYPGALGKADCFPTPFTLDTLTKSCVDKLSLEKLYFSRSFILRLIEQTWSAEKMRRGVVAAVPALVRPPRGFDGQIAALVAALAALIETMPANPWTGNVGDAAVFRRFGENRTEIAAVAEALGHLEALKSVHDALHLLQVLGAAWLDPPAEGRAAPADAAPLLALLLRVEAAAVDRAMILPDALSASCTRCLETSSDARRRIGTNDPDETAFALAAVRAMLIRELPLIDAAMFAISRDLPLRHFCGVFGDSPARDAAVDLGDTLRRRLMEHALWQATDLRLYAIEQILMQPTPASGKLMALLPWTVSDLRLLLDPATRDRVVPVMQDAVVRFYGMGGPGPAPAGGRLTGSLDDVRAAFAALRSAARSAFLEVDQALKQDFASLLALKSPLETILARVPPTWEMMLP